MITRIFLVWLRAARSCEHQNLYRAVAVGQETHNSEPVRILTRHWAAYSISVFVWVGQETLERNFTSQRSRILNSLFVLLLATDYRYEFTAHAHCLALRTWPILDLWLEMSKSRKFVIQGLIWTTKFESQVPTLLQGKKNTTKQTDESWCSRRLCIPFSKTGFTG
jgi:hypothetical protein